LIREWEGEIMTSSELQQRVRGFKAFKGIYKPTGSSYALWIRQTNRGVYPDKDPEIHPDGSWTYLYAPESQEGRLDTDLATNKGLERCMQDRVPVGVFRQVGDKVGKRTYRVLGLGYVQSFNGSHFEIRGEPIDESREPIPTGVVPPFAPFDPSPLPVQNVLRTLRERRFSSVIRELYHERCSLCEVGYRLRGRSLSLEAAHVIPLEANGITGDVRNGVLLCSNHHNLFDAYVWTFDKSYEVIVTQDRDFRDSALANHLLKREGKRLPNLPEAAVNYPAAEAVKWRIEEFERRQ
jgi:putative restriction endonuclease